MPESTITVDGNSFVAREITGLMGTKLPTVTDSGGVRRATVGDRLRFLVEPPGYIGFPESEDPHELDDAFNVLTMWGAFMRGPQKQSPTISALPATFKIDADGFYDAAGLGRLFLFGNGASADDEPLFYYDSGTDTWISGQVNSDLTGDVTATSGVVEIGGVFYMLGRELEAGEASNDKILYKMATLGVNTNFVDNGVAETLPAGYDQTRFLVEGTAVADQFWTLAYSSSADIEVQPIRRNATTSSATWGNPGGGGANLTVGTDPRGFMRYDAPDGSYGQLVSTEATLAYYDGTSRVSLHTYLNPTSAYTGRLAQGADGSVYFIDGADLYRLRPWETATSTRLNVDLIGRPNVLATDADDVFTALRGTQRRPWIELGLGGVKSTTKARRMIYDYKRDVFYGAPYQNGTAQRIITALAESSLDGGTVLEHIVEAQASLGDEHPVYFDAITSDPRQNSAFRFEGTLTMRIRDAERAFRDRGLFKGFKYVQVIADNIDASELLTPEYEHDGGAISSHSRDITSDGGIEWVDGATGTGAKARRQKVQWDFGGDAGTDDGPEVKAFVYIASIFPQTSGGAIPEKRRFLISFEDQELYNEQQGTANAWENLRISAAKGKNITIAVDEKTSFAGDIVIEDDSLVHYIPEEDRPGATLQIAGSAIITVEEVS